MCELVVGHSMAGAAPAVTVASTSFHSSRICRCCVASPKDLLPPRVLFIALKSMHEREPMRCNLNPSASVPTVCLCALSHNTVCRAFACGHSRCSRRRSALRQAGRKQTRCTICWALPTRTRHHHYRHPRHHPHLYCVLCISCCCFASPKDGRHGFFIHPFFEGGLGGDVSF